MNAAAHTSHAAYTYTYTAPPKLFAWMLTDPANPLLVGQVNRLQNGDVSLAYSASWVATGFALSADVPLGLNEYNPVHRRGRQTAAPGALDDARPDNWGEKVIRYLYKPRGTHLFDYLYLAGDDRFGALGLSSSDSVYTPFATSPLPRLQDAQSISEVAKIIQTGGELNHQQRVLASADASLGGAKPKAVISIDGEQWVLKLFNAEPVDQPLVKHAAMRLAALAGINVVETLPVRLLSEHALAEHALAIKRFDRYTKLGVAHRLHCVSAATVLRAETPPGEEPRYGYPHLARALRRSANPATVKLQLLDLFRRMVFNILMANTDDHEKNHSLVLRPQDERGQAVLELSKAYDIVPTGSGATAHKFLIGEDSPEPSLRLAMGGCAQFDLTPPAAAQVVQHVINVVNTWQTFFTGCGISQRDMQQLKLVIDRDDLLRERTQFSMADYPATPANTARSRTPRNPFL